MRVPRVLSISPPAARDAEEWVRRAPELVDAGADGLLLRVFGETGEVLERWLDGLMATGATVLVHASTPGGVAAAQRRGIGLHLPDGPVTRPAGIGVLGVSRHAAGGHAASGHAATGHATTGHAATGHAATGSAPQDTTPQGTTPQGTESEVDYLLLGPVFAPHSKRGTRPPLGLGVLARGDVPAIALGGIDGSNAAACLAAGAHGVAGIGRFGDPREIARIAAAVAREIARATAGDAEAHPPRRRPH